jgi:hypothetical protein
MEVIEVKSVVEVVAVRHADGGKGDENRNPYLVPQALTVLPPIIELLNRHLQL